jgi:putative tricarboxylic transport membrane protein
MRHLEMPVVPLLLALVLGRQLEEHLRVALTGSSGDPMVFFQSPFSVLFLSLSIISIVWSFASERGAGRARSAPST